MGLTLSHLLERPSGAWVRQKQANPSAPCPRAEAQGHLPATKRGRKKSTCRQQALRTAGQSGGRAEGEHGPSIFSASDGD